MHTLILVMYVLFNNTTIHVAQSVLPERYKDPAACEAAGQKMQVKTAPKSPAAPGIENLRVGYICIETGTKKPLRP
jgi:hypothetical protein